ncbi:hypothetical protein [Moraxella bovoculi]|uniref:hypothetical protein n=1 Tax=Moraxella bovoculi TaxID=386891 RepID=UPI001314A676|nr:hypothetical protein [Moraxella bovoculi]
MTVQAYNPKAQNNPAPTSNPPNQYRAITHQRAKPSPRQTVRWFVRLWRNS